ncbi:MBL fold metallo-hydrolase [Limnobacter litoralis]|uniref:MBL fold metallo-hydrolase n=1 Tax=Limnobacter litoralis TaxID=481366 RepID=A0ABQ5YSU2_9BURK|nr:MBL fold metallo-hydrolase [Limnobacter litoralis]GLR27710.1 MBL fold metallo-hydrolase [Limnobacter litoralis]
MRFSSLGSGSEGNAWLFESSNDQASPTRIMVDCGFTIKGTVARLDRMGLSPEQVNALIVTHEHDDHLGGVFKFSRKFNAPVFLTHGTWRAALRTKRTDAAYLQTGLVNLIESHQAFEVGSLSIQPFPVPHDALEPIQMLVSDGQYHVGILTDCGSSTPHLVRMLGKADALILESNHCPDMLLQSPYPDSLKRRVGGNYGHLSNQTACEILRSLVGGKLRFAVAAHLSKNTNDAKLVRTMWNDILAPAGVRFGVACQENGFDWWNVRDILTADNTAQA